MEQQLAPYRAHDGEMYPRPPGATADHVPVWHRFLDHPTGQMVEHISHWIVNPGPNGYLSATVPLDKAGNGIGDHRARCFECGMAVTTVNLSFYRFDGDVILIRCQDDPEWDRPSTPAANAEGMR